MSFERARTEENKKIRLDQIKQAAIHLYDHTEYHEISLASIAKELNFTRANLYKYVASKEEIFLYVMEDEMESLIQDFQSNLNASSIKDIHAFALTWAEILSKHPRFLQLSSILNQIVEQNASLDKLVAFKKHYMTISGRLYDIIHHFFPDLSDSNITRFVRYQTAFSVGLYPMCHPSDIQIEAGSIAGVKHGTLDFIDAVKTNVIYTIMGIRSEASTQQT